MAAIIRQFTATIPRNTPMNNLYTADFEVPVETVQVVEIEVPPGPSGLMGFYLAQSGQQIIPYEVGEFIVWDDIFKMWPLEDFPNANDWQLVGYNLDVANDHSVTVRFHDVPLTSSSTATPTITITNGAAIGEPVTL